MPVYFWNDEENVKYNNAYFAKYKGASSHFSPANELSFTWW
jgi:hypothetical protein